MIVAHSTDREGRLVLLVGLSEDDWQLLMSGKSILKTPEETTCDASVFVVGGKTIENVVEMLKSKGVNFVDAGGDDDEEP